MKKQKLWTALTTVVLSFNVLSYPLSIASAQEQTSRPTITETLLDQNINEITPTQNFFKYANYAWLLDHPIDDAIPSFTLLEQLSARNQLLLNEDVKRLVQGDIPADSIELQNFIDFYNLASNVERIETEGVEPLKTFINEIEAIKNFDDFKTTFITFAKYGYSLPANFGVAPDTTNVKQNLLQLGEPQLYFGTKDVYDDPEQLEPLEADFRARQEALLSTYGYSNTQVQQIIDESLAFDKQMAQYARTVEESARSTIYYNPSTVEEVAKLSTHLDFKTIIKELTGEEPQHINVTNPEYFKAFDQLVNPDNVANIRSWLIVQVIEQAAPYLTIDMQNALAVTAISDDEETTFSTSDNTSIDEEAPLPDNPELEVPEIDTYAQYLALQQYDQVIGQLFAQRHFSNHAKETVTDMTHIIIEAYKQRLEANTWLSDETKKHAIAKLDQLTVYVGAPDTLPTRFAKKVVDSSKSLLENVHQFIQQETLDNFASLSQQADQSDWGFPAYEVNAFYQPTNNSIYFPAGFLQAPNYDDAQTPSVNYGGIGTVIGHEISHAFDVDGALYDAEGNLTNWWTEKDFASFKERTDVMVKQWDGMEFAGGKVNGQLTVTENIADLSGMAVALDAVKQIANVDLRSFFIAYARTWAEAVPDEDNQHLMLTDSHAPSELRANIVPTHFEEFHQIFGTKPGDPMYRAPEDRLTIW